MAQRYLCGEVNVDRGWCRSKLTRKRIQIPSDIHAGSADCNVGGRDTSIGVDPFDSQLPTSGINAEDSGLRVSDGICIIDICRYGIASRGVRASVLKLQVERIPWTKRNLGAAADGDASQSVRCARMVDFNDSVGRIRDGV